MGGMETEGRLPLYCHLCAAAVALLGGFVPVMLSGPSPTLGARLSFWAGAALSNGWVMGLMALALLGSAAIGPAGGRLLRALAAVAVLAYCADAIVAVLFGTRFFVRDALAFGGDPGHWLRFASVGLSTGTSHLWLAAGLAAIGLAGAAGMVAFAPARPGRRAAGLAAAGCAACVAAGLGTAGLGGSGGWPEGRGRAATALEIAVTDTSGARYSPERRRRAAESVAGSRPPVLAPRLNPAPRRPDIVLLVIESWSSYQSRFFGGAADWTPRLDAIAARSWAFTNFHANGLTTEDGLVALLAGQEPVMPASGPRRGWLECFTGFVGAEGALPALLRPAGYRSCFLTTGPIRFSCKHQFLDGAGFDFLSDGGDAFYAAGDGGRPWPQAMFGPPDRALYRRALDLMGGALPGESGDRGPRLLVLETTSSHLPLNNPEGPPHHEAAVMAYVDREAAAFVGELESRGFFRRGGLLAVTSDHRAMVPPRPEEAGLFGESAPWRVPLFFVADWLPRAVADGRHAAQADIAASLEWLAAGGTRAAGRRCALLDPGCPPARFFVARGRAARHAIWLEDRLTGARGMARLAGDRSRCPEGLEQALDWAEWERMAREPLGAMAPDARAPLRHARMLGAAPGADRLDLGVAGR